MEKLVLGILSAITVKDIIIAIGGIIVGIFATWLITRHYSQTTMDAIDNLAKTKPKAAIRPLSEVLKKIEKELSKQSLDQMIEMAYSKMDSELLEKALFFGSLSKMDNEEDVFIGFLEMQNYPSELFSRYLPYVLAKLITSDNPTKSAFLLSLLIDKLGPR